MLSTLLPLMWPAPAHAGLGPTHTVVIVHGDDPNAVAVAEAYAEARELPGGHICPIVGVAPGTDQVDFTTFVGLRDQVEACVAALPQPEDIDALVTVRGLPYVVSLDAFVVGFEAALQVGRGIGPDGEIAGQPQPGSPANAWAMNPTYVGGRCDAADLVVSNPSGSWYSSSCELVSSERLPRSHQASRPTDLPGYDLQGELRVVSRLDGFDYNDAMDLVERGVAADGTFPTGDWLCMEGADPARSARDPECEHAVRHLALSGESGVWESPHDPNLAGAQVVAYLTGAASLQGAIDGQTYALGALACNLTSYGAVPANFHCSDDGTVCPESESQTSIARFVRAGATGVHGTVAEPLNNSFPDAGMMLLYASGYSLGESALFAQQFLYWQNLLLGDPLTTPFAARPEVSVAATADEGGQVVVTATHADGIDDIRLYLDDVLVATGADAGELRWDHDHAAGVTLQLRAVAVADDATFTRPGWPVESQQVRAHTQGWTLAQVEITAAVDSNTGPDPGTESGNDPQVVGDSESTGGCGCRASTGWRGPALHALTRRR